VFFGGCHSFAGSHNALFGDDESATMRPDRRAADEGRVASETTDSDAAAGRLAAHVEVQDGERACTLFPANADGDELVTTWVTAEDGAFVSLADWR